ncbi:MAG TPA: prolyl oligopeptidase family serine peptidase [Sunxiuqinia sp.]|nr:prolyl oligopeptidase family serine peptidase [Sunxiuqinia sp.]
MISCSDQSLKYPETRKDDVVDVYFGTKVADPYRWLEDDNSKETADWVKAENATTFAYLRQLPNCDKIRQQLTKVLNYPRMGTPLKKRGKYFFYKNDGLQDQNVLYMTDDLAAEPKLLLDPNKLSKDGTVSLTDIEVSDDGSYLVYMVSRSGSDWNEIFVKNIETGETLKDHIKWVKFSELAWFKNGFYYSAYAEPDAGAEYSESSENQKIFYHKLGTSQSDDQLIMSDPERPQRMFFASMTEDKRFLCVAMAEASNGNALSVRDMAKAGANYVPLMTSFDYEYVVVDNVGDDLFVRTNYKAPKYRLVKIDMNHPSEKNWVETIPEKLEVLQSASLVDGKIVTEYMKDAHCVVEVYDYDGKFEHEIALPGIGSAGTFSGQKDDPVAFYSYTSFNTPVEIYQYDFRTEKSSLFYRPEISFNPDDFVVKQDFYKSKDGTRVPIFIVHKKGIKLNGNNPTLLYGYGGFNISMTPVFSSTRLVFMQNGGVFAVPNIRGGGEYGEEWHEAGTKLKKQNVFDDFIGAAQYLINQKYTNSNKLAVMGGSNGGLLVGAVINQRPDLFKVALPAVGVMDMLRYQKFTIGWAWAGDYGTSADSKKMFDYLYHYSPYHNIKNGVDYPAVLVTTADHDDRVVPAHSFKYIARMQAYDTGELPKLIRIDIKAGHGAGKPISKMIDEYSDVWSFLFYHLDMKM